MGLGVVSVTRSTNCAAHLRSSRRSGLYSAPMLGTPCAICQAAGNFLENSSTNLMRAAGYCLRKSWWLPAAHKDSSCNRACTLSANGMCWLAGVVVVACGRVTCAWRPGHSPRAANSTRMSHAFFPLLKALLKPGGDGLVMGLSPLSLLAVEGVADVGLLWACMEAAPSDPWVIKHGRLVPRPLLAALLRADPLCFSPIFGCCLGRVSASA